VTSKVGEGSTFHVYLPTAKEKQQSVAAVTSPIQSGNESILVVDDEHTVTAVVLKVLRRFGYTVTVINNPKKALDRFKTTPNAFDLLLTDLTMPELSGLRLAAEMRAIDNTLPVVLMTGYGTGITQETTRKYGISETISKPLDIETLTTVIRTHLDKKKQTPQ
jgi:DNA-binding NtrC family response regulator